MKAEEEQRRQQKERVELEKLRQAEEKKRFVFTLHEHLKNFRNVGCLLASHNKVQDMRAKLKTTN